MRNVSYSEIRTAQRCPWKWHLQYCRRLVPKKLEEKEALQLGTEGHAVLAKSYALYGLMLEGLSPEMAAVFEEYRPVFEDDLATQRVLDVEFCFSVDVPTYIGTRSNYRMRGIIDLITADLDTEGGRVAVHVYDHKFQSRLSPVPLIDFQSGIYAWALSRMGVRVDSTILNKIRTRVGSSPCHRRDTHYYTADEIGQWGFTIYSACLALPSTTDASHTLPRQLCDQCSWDCDYREVCRLSLEGRTIAAAELLDEGFERSTWTGPNRAYVETRPASWLVEETE